MPNRSLDDFAGGGEEETEADASDAETAEADPEPEAETEAVVSESAPETAETDDSADEPTLTVEEATPTYDFSPDGATCEACGATVETRWHAAEAGMVCADCKGWE